MAEFRDILQARHNQDWTSVTELSLTRAYEHVLTSGAKSLAMVTAYRSAAARNFEGELCTSENTLAANRASNKMLRADLAASELVYSKLITHWNEPSDSGALSDRDSADETAFSREEVFFVHDISLDATTRLLKKYDQRAGVYQGPETDGHLWLVLGDGSHAVIGAKFSPTDIAAAYCTRRGARTVVIEYVAQSNQEALTEQTFLNNNRRAQKPAV